MSDPTPRGPHPDGIRQPPAQGSLENTFLTQKRYPGETIAPSPPPHLPPPPSSRRVFIRIVLPLLIFVAAIGVIAWVMQYLPSRGQQVDQPAPQGNAATKPLFVPSPLGPAEGDPALRIYTAVWEARQGDEKRTPYAAEYEVSANGRLDAGYYDFVLRNISGAPAELGLAEKSCRCSSVKACALTTADWEAYRKAQTGADLVKHTADEPKDGFTWKTLAKEDQGGLAVPADARTVIRLYWDGNKQEPERVTMTARVWANPAGQPAARRFAAQLNATVAYTRPALFDPERVDVGALSPKGVSRPLSFVCWSATRDLKVRVQDRNADPRFVFTVAPPLDVQARQKLEAELRALNIPTRVRSAYRVHVTVHEQKGGKQLDLGSFQRSAPLAITGNGEEINVATPVVRGTVLGEIRLGGTLGDQDKINLKNFKARFGTMATVKLWARPGLELVYEDFSPAVLDLKVVSLRKKADEREADWTVWELKLTVPPNIEPGPLPDDSVIVLRVQGTDRRMRIPVVGTAGRG